MDGVGEIRNKKSVFGKFKGEGIFGDWREEGEEFGFDAGELWYDSRIGFIWLETVSSGGH